MKKLDVQDVSSLLKNASIFTLFPKACMPHFEIHAFEPKEWLVQESNSIHYFYYVLSGKGKVYSTQQNGKVMLLHFIAKHSFIGDMELLEERYETKGVQASERMLCLALPMSFARNFLLEDARFLRKLSAYLGARINAYSSKFSQSLSYPLENRLAEYMLISAIDYIYDENHTEVAAFLGVSYRHLLYVYRKFVDEGILVKEKKRYKIVNPRYLQQIATSIFSPSVISC